MTRATRPHECPHCTCTWDDHIEIDTLAPFYYLVQLVDAASNERPKATK